MCKEIKKSPENHKDRAKRKTNMKKIENLLSFIDNSPTAYHTVNSVKEQLIAAGFTQLSVGDSKAYSDGGRHFVIAGGSSIIAFEGKGDGFMITASHSDSPAFRVKSGIEIRSTYNRLSVEKYGGMIHYTWLDRPLSIAGRVVIKTDTGIEERLVNLDRDTMIIPSVAIHLNRSVNDGAKHNPAIDLIPLLGKNSDTVESAIAEKLSVKAEDIISHDLFVYNRDKGRVCGISDELIVSPRLDDLQCVHASLRGFLDSPENKNAVKVLAVFDNEEVGSETKQGAASAILHDTLKRIAGTEENYYRMLENSFMVSADNAHALHPNHPELSDKENAPTLGGGVVIKHNGNQRYTTDGVSDAILRSIGVKANVAFQHYYNRADIPGGSTLGSIATTKVPISSVDIGLPQLAMHSANETASVSDYLEMEKLLTAVYSSHLVRSGNKTEIR